MGTLLMANMVQEALDGPKQKLHPFFIAGNPPVLLPTDSNSNGGSSDTSNLPHAQQEPYIDSGDGPAVDSEQNESRKKRQKTDHDFEPNGKDKKKVRRGTKKPKAPLTGTITDHLILVNTKTSEVEGGAAPDPVLATHTETTAPLQSLLKDGNLKLNVMLAPERPRKEKEERPGEDTVSKPRKLLQFNPKTGTIGSPPKPKVLQTEIPKLKRKGIPEDKPSKFLVSIKYGQDVESRARLGCKITEILESSPLTQQPETKAKPPRKTRTKVLKEGVEKSSPATNPHPFFGGKTKKGKDEPDSGTPSSATQPRPTRNTVFTSTPCSPKSKRSVMARIKLPQFGVKSTGTKFPGALRPPWPYSGMVHVRGDPDSLRSQFADMPTIPFSSRKSKGQATTVPPQESIINRIGQFLCLDSISNSMQKDFDDYEVPPVQLRLPKKHFESGRRLRARILPELRTRLPSRGEMYSGESDDELIASSTRKAHPAIALLHKSLETNLSAFDKSQCEDVCWAQKYAPSTAAEVLQGGRDATLLKEWLQALKVQSVDTGNSIIDQKSAAVKTLPTMKKKRKRNKLDGFVVSSDEEAAEMGEVSDTEEEWAPVGVHGLGKKTVIRGGDAAVKGFKDPGRLTNAAIISGPHGCGKTAAVYAIAKELGFEIFEINASSRRTGKDVLEKVGDMTRNHLVQRHHEDQKTMEDGDATEDEVARDLKSGKQGTMTSFFKAKPAAKPKTASKQKPQNPSSTAEKAPQPKAQKQSLILLEEVDILYDEDKQFWATIIGLIAQSKRPFIMTCNDENLIPIQSLNLHGIFRFSLPPEDLAIDVLLLIAANEGHALRRSDVHALYRSRFKDLRASITELNYWCQLGVGDRRGGFDWFYPRWPYGCDKDEDGSVVRVVSEETYLGGMGMFGRDSALSLEPLDAEEDILSQCWQGLQLDVGDWHGSIDTNIWTKELIDENASAGERMAALDLYDEFSSIMSASDISSSGAFGLGNQEVLDPTRPAFPAKFRDDFIIGRQLIEATPLISYQPTHLAISQWLRSHARSFVQAAHETRGWPRPSSMDCIQEPQAIAIIDKATTESSSWSGITRYDLSLAFDPIAISEKAASSLTISNHLEPSVFDRTTKMITLDVAPYVRSIVAYDERLKIERLQRSNLLSEGGRPGKRMRNTRSAFSALEGGARGSTRKENYFLAKLNTHLVMRTAGLGWESAVEAEIEATGHPVSRASSVIDGISSPASALEDPNLET